MKFHKVNEFNLLFFFFSFNDIEGSKLKMSNKRGIDYYLHDTYFDANWVDDPIDHYSTTSCYFLLGTSLISKSKLTVPYHTIQH